MARDFVIGALHGCEALGELVRLAPRPSCDGAALARLHTRGELVDLSGLVRDTLLRLRALETGGERALLVVRVLHTLDPEPRGEVALAVVTRLEPFELKRLPRAGLVALGAAVESLEAEWADIARTLLAPLLAARPRTTRRTVGDALLCAEGVERTVMARAVLKLREGERPGVVFLVAPGEVLSAADWAELLEAEGRATDDLQLTRYGALARGGACRLISSVEVWTPTALSRVVAALRALVQRAWHGGDAEVSVRTPSTVR